jgi:hypothetical protein
MLSKNRNSSLITVQYTSHQRIITAQMFSGSSYRHTDANKCIKAKVNLKPSDEMVYLTMPKSFEGQKNTFP